MSSVSLFGSGSFTLHSGRASGLKIDCDALTEADWDTLARLAKVLVGPYSAVVSPGGAGSKFAHALNRYCERGVLLVADDVLTTGQSMQHARETHEDELVHKVGVKGIVAFARGPLPDWVQAIFHMNKALWGR